MKNRMLGLFLMAAIAVFAGLVLFLKPSIGDHKQTLLIRFSNINKVNVGTRVLFAGKAVGEVTAIQEIQDARQTEPTDALGRLFFYQLTLKIDSSVRVYSSDHISLQTSGLLGEKSVAIIPKAPRNGGVAKLLTDQTPFYADSVDPIENTMDRLQEATAALSHIFQNLSSAEGTVGKLLYANDMYVRMTGLMSKADILMNDINHYGLLFHLNKGWQKSRTRKVAKLETLTTPTDFKKFFQLEVDQINTSMARLSMMLDKAKETEDALFHDYFAKLTQHIEEMSNHLRLSNHTAE